MGLVSLHIIGFVAINVFFGLKLRLCGPNEDFCTIGGYSYFGLLFYYILSKDRGL